MGPAGASSMSSVGASSMGPAGASSMGPAAIAPRRAASAVPCLLPAAEVDADRDDVLAQARAAGVQLVLAMGEGYADNLRVLELSRAYPAQVLPCLGLHPARALHEPVEPVLEQIRAHAAQLAAIGEVGLDFWAAKLDEERARQKQALERLVSLALALDLPLSVHSRSAGHQTIDLLVACGAQRVCLHAFAGSAKHAARAVDLGYLCSVPPSVTRSEQKQKLVRRLPLASLMLETDAPVLGPDPQARNVPANVMVSARAVAELKGCAVEAVLRVTTENARRLFRLDRFAGLASTSVS